MNCWRGCSEFGLVVVCCDDLCRGSGRCIHGSDGMALCECQLEDEDWEDELLTEELGPTDDDALAARLREGKAP